MNKRIATLIAAGCMLAIFQTAPALAQTTTIIVPFAAGGTTDLSIRTIVAAIDETTTGRRFVLENRTGAGGVVAAGQFKSAKPDGRTLLLANYSISVINPLTMQNLPYDPIVDFRPVMTLFSFPLVIMVPASLPVNSLAELIALSKTKKDGLSYGSPGIGTAPHVLGELLARETNAKMVHIPYKGASQAVIDLVSGAIDTMFVGILPSQGFITKGQLRALAVTSRTRLPQLPNVPTTAEMGFPSINSDFIWVGMSAPAGTPDAIIRELHATFSKTIATPALQERLASQGVTVLSSTPEEMAARIKSELVSMAPVLKAMDIKKQ